MPARLTLIDLLFWIIAHAEVEMALARNNVERALVVCRVLAEIEDVIAERGGARYLYFVSGDSLGDWMEQQYAPKSAFGIASMQFECYNTIDGGAVLCFNPRRITLLSQYLEHAGSLEYKDVLTFIKVTLDSVLANVRPEHKVKAIIDFKTVGDICRPIKKRRWTIDHMIRAASRSTARGQRPSSDFTIVDFDFRAKSPYVTVVDRQ